MDINLLQLINDYMGDGKVHRRSDRTDNWPEFKKQLAYYGISDNEIIAFWNTGYLAETAIYEHKEYRRSVIDGLYSS